jgi:hypothetical protein
VGSPTVEDLYRQATDIVAQNAGTTDAAAHSAALYAELVHYSDSLNHITAYGLFPLCVALLILHEQTRAMTDGGHFRLAFVFGRIVIIAVLVYACYGNLCRLITSVFGGGSGWMRTDQLLKMFDQSGLGLSRAWDNMTDGLGMLDSVLALGKFLALLGIWLIVLGCALFAYVAGLLLSSAQAILMTICLAVGTTCLTLSLVPGIRLAGSWARALALTAAWSRIAGVIAAMFPVNAGKPLYASLIAGNFGDLLFIAGRYVLLAFATLAVPAIAAKIGSGAGGVAAGVSEILRGASRRAGGAWRSLSEKGRPQGSGPMDSRRDGDARAGGGPPGRGGTPSSGARHLGSTESPLRTATRPTPGALREGLSAVSSLALAPFALLFSRSKPRAPETEAPDPSRGAGVARPSAGAPAVWPHARAQVHSAVGEIPPSGADPDRRAPSSALAEHRPTMEAFDRGVGDAPLRSQSVPPGTHEEGSAHGVANPQAPDRLQRTQASEDRGVGSAKQQAGMSTARATASPTSVPEANAAPSAPAAQPGPAARPRPPEAKGPAQGQPGASRISPAASRVPTSTLDSSQSHAAAPAPVSRPVVPVAPGRPSHPQVLRRETLIKNEQPPATLRREEE